MKLRAGNGSQPILYAYNLIVILCYSADE